MKRLKSVYKIWLTLGCVSWLAWGSSLQAAPYFSIEQNQIPDEILLKGCPRDKLRVWNDNKREPVPQDFVYGLCAFHDGSDQVQVQGIEALQTAQTTGLGPAQQNLAALFEGLMHCRAANRALTASGNDLKKSMLQKDLFCAHRAMAAENFGDINWSVVDLSYANPGSKYTLASHIESMSACYESVLVPEFDALCGMISSLGKEELAGVVNRATRPIVDRYFPADCTQYAAGSSEYDQCMKRGAESPIGGMFARKIQLTEDTITGSVTAIQSVNKEAERLKRSSQSLEAAIEPFAAAASQVVNRYRNTALLAYQILDEYERWEKGLWQKGTQNLKSDFEKAMDALVEEGDRLSKTSAPQAKDSILDRAIAISTRLQDILGDQSKTNESIASLCAVYFCEITKSERLSKLKKLCTGNQDNPLCVNEQGQSAGLIRLSSDDRGKTSRQICKEAGFAEDLMVIGMKNEDGASCMNRLYRRPQ